MSRYYSIENDMWIDDEDSDLLELRTKRFNDRVYHSKFMAHPDCRDPDHPGCERCWDESEDDEQINDEEPVPKID